MSTYPHSILCVDDEKNILNSLRRLLRQENYNLLTASSGAEGLKLLEETHVQLVISDQRMPEMSGVDFLSQVREKYPEIIRIILSGYTDVNSITEAINKGHIYKFILKPWDDQNFFLEIRQALQKYDLIEDNQRLHQQVLRQNEELKRMNENLEQIVAARTSELGLQNQALELSHAILEDIPLSIIGLSAEGFVAVINRKTQQMRHSGFLIEIGQRANEIFPQQVIEKIRYVLSSAKACRIERCGLQGIQCDLEIHPLSGRFLRKGVVITMCPNSGLDPLKTD
jgi:response regulator RpfG family c-di-GMP phosphodiesterase